MATPGRKTYPEYPLAELDETELRRVISVETVAASRAHAVFCTHEKLRVAATQQLHTLLYHNEKKGEASAGTPV